MVTFDPVVFRAQFAPTFDDDTAYPNALLNATFDQATCYVANDTTGNIGSGCLLILLNNLTAHLLTIQKKIAAGETVGIVKSSRVGSVAVTREPPTTEGEQFTWWLNLTPYGSAVAAQLDIASAAGFLGGPCDIRAGYRNPAGGFNRY